MKRVIQTKSTSAHLKKLVLLFLAIAYLTPAASAQIVYSARYYYPAGEHKLSCYHLYYYNLATKLNKELTFGRWRDTHPRFSPNGHDIAFIRTRPYAEDLGNGGLLCVYSLSRSRLVREIPIHYQYYPGRISWSETGNAVKVDQNQPIIIRKNNHRHNRYNLLSNISPGGRYRFIYSAKVPALIKVFSFRNHQMIREYRSRFFRQVCWSGSSSLTALSIPSPANHVIAKVYTWHVDSSLQPVSSAISTTATLHLTDQIDLSQIVMIQSTIPHCILLTEDHENSTLGPQYSIQEYNVHTSKCKTLESGAILCFSPHWRRYITLPYRDMTQYDSKRYLWTRPLIINYSKNQPHKDLIYGLVDVRDADWSGGHRVWLNSF